MAKTRQQKEVVLSDLSERISAAKSIVFADVQGLKAKDSEALRGECRTQGVGFVFGKKTLMKKALAERGIDVDTKSFGGAVSALFGLTDEVLPAQLIATFAKKHEVVKIFGGVLEGAFIDANKVKALSALPSKQELLGRLVGSINAPVSGFVNVLAGNLRGLVTVLSAIKDKKPV